MTQKQMRAVRERLEGELERIQTGFERPRLAETIRITSGWIR